MKFKYLFLFTAMVALSFTGCIVDETEKIKDKAANDEDFVTQIEWTSKSRELGTIEEGQKVEVIYEFKNTGKKPLVIKSVQASCGCTVPERPDAPIMPGKTGVIKAVFDSQGRPGNNHKSISVMANTDPSPSHVLEFNIDVKAKAEAGA